MLVDASLDHDVVDASLDHDVVDTSLDHDVFDKCILWQSKLLGYFRIIVWHEYDIYYYS